MLLFIVVSFCCCCLALNSCQTFCDLMDYSTPGSSVLDYLPEFDKIHVHSIGDAIYPSIYLLPPLLLPSIYPRIRVFPHGSALHIRWQKYRSFSISLSNGYLGWFLLELTGLTCLKSKGLSRVFPAPQIERISLKHSAFFMVQLSHVYMITGKTIALTIWTFVSKVMSLL